MDIPPPPPPVPFSLFLSWLIWPGGVLKKIRERKFSKNSCCQFQVQLIFSSLLLLCHTMCMFLNKYIESISRYINTHFYYFRLRTAINSREESAEHECEGKSELQLPDLSIWHDETNQFTSLLLIKMTFFLQIYLEFHKIKLFTLDTCDNLKLMSFK